MLSNYISTKTEWFWYSEIPTDGNLSGNFADKCEIYSTRCSAENPAELAEHGEPSTPVEVLSRGLEYYWLK